MLTMTQPRATQLPSDDATLRATTARLHARPGDQASEALWHASITEGAFGVVDLADLYRSAVADVLSDAAAFELVAPIARRDEAVVARTN